MDVQFGLRRGPTTVNRRTVTDFHFIMNPSLLSVDMFTLVIIFMFSILIVRYNDDCLGYQISTIMPSMNVRHNKKHNPS